jgi:hypothetical protein
MGRSTPFSYARDPGFEPWSKEKYLEVPHDFPLSLYVNAVFEIYNKTRPVPSTSCNSTLQLDKRLFLGAEVMGQNHERNTLSLSIA